MTGIELERTIARLDGQLPLIASSGHIPDERRSEGPKASASAPRSECSTPVEQSSPIALERTKNSLLRDALPGAEPHKVDPSPNPCGKTQTRRATDI